MERTTTEASHHAAPPPGALVHVYAFTAPDRDMDFNGHVSNVAYVRWIQEAAIAHCDDQGWTQQNLEAAGGVFVVRRHVIDYRRPCKAGARITIDTWIGGGTAASATRETRIRADDVEVVSATTQWVFISLRSKRPCRIPDAVARCFMSEIASTS
jgi:acyl-CoA thioester hydrolase